MAKLGEGDARWIVQERPDGTNVNNWHWTERDVMGWSRGRLEELLVGAQLADTPQAGAKLTGVQELEGAAVLPWGDTVIMRCVDVTRPKSPNGDAVINMRKKKLIATYELKLVLGWEGSAKAAGGAPVSGKITLPYVSEENHDEDPEVTVSATTEGPEAETVRQAVLASGRKVVTAAIQKFVAELRAGGPYAKGGSMAAAVPTDGNKPGSAAAQNSAQQKTQSPAESSQPARIAAPAQTSKGPPADKAGSRTVTLTERFYCRPPDLFEALTDERRISAYTQSEAKSDVRPGGVFSMFNGTVSGTYREVEPPGRIVMDWRFNHWPDGVLSKVTMNLEEPDKGTTVLKLQQTGIPEYDRFGNEMREVERQVEEGWKAQILHRLRAVFGFGM